MLAVASAPSAEGAPGEAGWGSVAAKGRLATQHRAQRDSNAHAITNNKKWEPQGKLPLNSH